MRAGGCSVRGRGKVVRFSPNAMDLTRSSGILLHPTSLPNGVLDEHAYRFVDWLEAAGQRWWQVLPLGPPEGITGSPYMSPSAFAGSPELLAKPRARVTRDEAFAFRARNAYWIEDWLAHGGSLDDQVRFEREWQALRSYARGPWRAAVRRHPDLRVAGGRRPHRPPAALPPRRGRRECRRTRSRAPASSGGIRSTTGARCAPTTIAGGSNACAACSSSST